MPPGFVWPDFGFIAFYEHSGEEREANARVLDEPTASVADRRSILPPSAKAWHFIGTVHDFVHAYPLPIRRHATHVVCGTANWASWRTWPSKILDGSMLRSAEELLWVSCLGDQSCNEQPPTAHQHIMGPPTYVINGNEFGAPSKTYYKWARNLPSVQPTDRVPLAEQWSELAVSGTDEEKMVKRSYTPRNMAEAEAAAHAHVPCADASDCGRPASKPCRQYAGWRKQLLHSFGLLAAHYAPTLSATWLRQAERQPAIIMVPIAHSQKGACAMVSLTAPEGLFGAQRDPKRSGADQGEGIAAFISGGVPTQYAAPLRLYEHPDVVVMVPWATAPVTVVTTVQQRMWARDAGLSAVWCTNSNSESWRCMRLRRARRAIVSAFNARRSTARFRILHEALALKRYKQPKKWYSCIHT